MPSAAFHPNGTLFAICNNGHTISRSSHGWDGEWSPLRMLGTPMPGHGGWEDPLFTPLIFTYSIVGLLAGMFCFVVTTFFIDYSAKKFPFTVTRCAWISGICFPLGPDLMGTLVGRMPEHNWFWTRKNCNTTCMGLANARCGANMSSVATSGASSCSAELMSSESPASVVYGKLQAGSVAKNTR